MHYVSCRLKGNPCALCTNKCYWILTQYYWMGTVWVLDAVLDPVLDPEYWITSALLYPIRIV